MQLNFSQPTQLTPNNGKNHFFGYYAISPWSKNCRYFICLETNFHDHMPKFGEEANILLMDLKENENRIIASTKGWNFQQGSMLYWLPEDPNKKIIFNDTDGKKCFSTVLNIETEEKYNLPLAINAVGKKYNKALCVSFPRLRRNRKVCSYPCELNYPRGAHPKDDGIFIMDIDDGGSELITSLDDIWNANEYTKKISKFRFLTREFWFNHLAFNPTDTRFFFLARFRNWNRTLNTSMWTMNPDGSEPYLMVDFGQNLSHFEWNNEDEIIVTMKYLKETKHSHIIMKDKSKEVDIIAPKKLTRNGHPAKHPHLNIFATDTYPIHKKRYVCVVDMDEKPESIQTVATFIQEGFAYGNLRCDPHPRWSPDGKYLSYDGLGKNGRQIYIIKLNK